MVYGLVAPGYDMAEVVVNKLTGGAKTFTGFDMSTKLKLIGIDVASFGDPFIADEDARSIIYHDNHNSVYKRINVSNDGKTLLGGVLVGDAEAYNQLQQICVNKLAIPPSPVDLIVKPGKDSGTESNFELPDAALICSCEGVTKLAISEAVNEGNESFDAVKKCTGAGSGCGGCTPMVKDIITATLKNKVKLFVMLFASTLIIPARNFMILQN